MEKLERVICTWIIYIYNFCNIYITSNISYDNWNWSWFLKALVMWLIKGSLILSILEGIKTSIPLLIASMLLGFVAIYLLPIAIINYIKRWKFIDAFNFKDIFNKIFTSKYLISWIIATVISTIITGILHIIPFIGDKIGLFVSGIISITILAQAYNEIK